MVRQGAGLGCSSVGGGGWISPGQPLVCRVCATQTEAAAAGVEIRLLASCVGFLDQLAGRLIWGDQRAGRRGSQGGGASSVCLRSRQSFEVSFVCSPVPTWISDYGAKCSIGTNAHATRGETRWKLTRHEWTESDCNPAPQNTSNKSKARAPVRGNYADKLTRRSMQKKANPLTNLRRGESQTDRLPVTRKTSPVG